MEKDNVDDKNNDLPSAVDDAADVMSKYKKRKIMLNQKVKNLSFRQLITKGLLTTKFFSFIFA